MRSCRNGGLTFQDSSKSTGRMTYRFFLTAILISYDSFKSLAYWIATHLAIPRLGK